jgi:hypothetical protein
VGFILPNLILNSFLYSVKEIDAKAEMDTNPVKFIWCVEGPSVVFVLQLVRSFAGSKR